MTGLVQPFISTVMGSLDSKGRVCIPAPYRHILAAQNTQGVYVCPSFAEAALDAFGQTVIDTVHARLSAQDPFFSPVHDDEAIAVISQTQLLVADEQGRVRLPDALIEHARLKDKVSFVGLSQKFQIWDAETYAPIQAEALARMKARLERARAAAQEGGA
ncbi:MAG: division/cell wall cluster transcriptional repressor MraZ [Alphaproteobacteria bacterium]|nr:division/cell wall cluster transcriptional repressor MraZ [Alphaproteobacteria bacterium]